MATKKKNVVINDSEKIITIAGKTKDGIVKVDLKPGRNSKITDGEIAMLKASDYFEAHTALELKA